MLKVAKITKMLATTNEEVKPQNSNLLIGFKNPCVFRSETAKTFYRYSPSVHLLPCLVLNKDEMTSVLLPTT